MLHCKIDNYDDVVWNKIEYFLVFIFHLMSNDSFK